jgi:hypothetical protein
MRRALKEVVPVDMAKVPESDKRVQWIKRIEKQILEYGKLRFTGKVVFALNVSQGGITDGSIQTDSKLS